MYYTNQRLTFRKVRRALRELYAQQGVKYNKMSGDNIIAARLNYIRW
jgi:hypothetical protein